MEKRNGFVFAETIIVVVVLCIGLIALYTLFSRVYISEKRRVNYDNTDNMYYIYYLKEFLEENNVDTCFYKFEAGQMYTKLKTTTDVGNEDICDLFSIEFPDLYDFYYNLLDRLEIEDIYITNYNVAYLKNNEALNRLDAKLIHYIETLVTNESLVDLETTDAYRLIVKFKNQKFASLKIGGEINYYDVDIEITDDLATISPNNIRVKSGTNGEFLLNLSNPNAYVDEKSIANCGGTYDSNTKIMTIKNITTDINCTLVVKRPLGSLNNYILADNTLKYTPTLEKVAVSQNTWDELPSNGEGLTKANSIVENGLYSYGGNIVYYRGEVENNYLTFAGKLWRIIRINEDRSVRLIAQESILWNYNLKNNTLESMNYANSNAKTALDDWYYNSIRTYDSQIVTGKYCNGLNAVIDDTNGGILYDSYTPTLNCEIYEQYKVGLITYDEMVFAGGHYNVPNNSFYLKYEETIYTMSPAGFDNTKAYIWELRAEGSIYEENEFNTDRYLRPVINIEPDITVTGLGNLSSPYEVIQ